MNFGISENSMNLILGALARWGEIEKAFIFGSRAMGNYKNGSDVDLVIYGSRVIPEIVNRLSVLLNEELPLPYYFDVVHYESLTHESLKAHINEFGKNFMTVLELEFKVK